jgi:Uma2 family endonuclease
LAYDRRLKGPLYARSGIREYWLVDLDGRVVAVHRDPSPAGYQSVRIAQPGEQISPAVLRNVQLDVADVVA